MERMEVEKMVEEKATKFAKISLIFGVLGLLTCLIYGGVFGIIGLVYGIFVLKDKMDGKNMAIAGVVMSVIAIVITALMVHMSAAMLKSGAYDAQMNRIYNGGDMFQGFVNELEQGVKTATPPTAGSIEGESIND